MKKELLISQKQILIEIQFHFLLSFHFAFALLLPIHAQELKSPEVPSHLAQKIIVLDTDHTSQMPHWIEQEKERYWHLKLDLACGKKEAKEQMKGMEKPHEAHYFDKPLEYAQWLEKLAISSPSLIAFRELGFLYAYEILNMQGYLQQQQKIKLLSKNHDLTPIFSVPTLTYEEIGQKFKEKYKDDFSMDLSASKDEDLKEIIDEAKEGGLFSTGQLSYLYDERGKREKAIEYMQKLIHLFKYWQDENEEEFEDEEIIESKYFLAYLYHKYGDLEKEQRIFQNAKDDALSRTLLLYHRQQMKQARISAQTYKLKGISFFEKAAALGDLISIKQLVALYQEQKEYPKAIQWCLQEIKMKKTQWTLFNLSHLYELNHQDDLAQLYRSIAKIEKFPFKS